MLKRFLKHCDWEGKLRQTASFRSLVARFGIGTGAVVAILFAFVDLKPQVEENFFFSSKDPQFKADKIISDIFPQPPQLIIGVKGKIKSEEYVEKIRAISAELSSLPEVFSVQSLTEGPDGLEDALKSPLWRRVLISEAGDASFISVFVREGPPEEFVLKVEAIRDRFESPDFHLMISGAPYLIELIRRNLTRDLRIFTLAAFVVFGIVLFFLFRSVGILLGTFFATVSAGAATLILTRLLRIEIGPLTANLTTIVFVMTLSHILFLTFNWKELRNRNFKKSDLACETVRITCGASFWSMVTTLLGFLSLLTVQAAPLRQLGISGSVGTLVAFLTAYGVFPWFLQMQGLKLAEKSAVDLASEKLKPRVKLKKGKVVAALVLLALFGISGLAKINTDPDLLSYFRKGSELREGLDYIDQNGGSSPLKIVVVDQDKKKFNSGPAYTKLWRLHEAFEEDPAVGSVVSLPILLAEAKRSPFSRLISNEWLLKILESPRFGEVARYFVTEDRGKTLFLLRMKEGGRKGSRVETVERLKQIAAANGFGTALVGGVYQLQGKMSQLLTSSLFSGLTFLILVFFAMGWFLSHSLKISLALFAALVVIPLGMLGLIGHLGIPLDIISAPAANLAIGMGVDSMIHLLFFVRRTSPNQLTQWEAWCAGVQELWKPVVSTTVVISSGFAIFLLSGFPPTGRFGFSVVLGSSISALCALFVLPWFAAYGVSNGAKSVFGLKRNES